MDIACIKNFYQRFPSEEVCRQYIETLRWPNGRTCPHCDSVKTYKFKDGVLFKCAACKRQFTVKVGTIFTDSHVTLQDWLLTVTLLTSGPERISSTKLAEYLQITQKTAWFMLRRIRYALEHGIAESEIMDRKKTESYVVRLSFEQAMDRIIVVPLTGRV